MSGLARDAAALGPADQADDVFSSGTDLLQGQGAFAGLTYRVLWARERPMSAPGTSAYVVSGWIEPAE
jgi:hypothetical protein